MQSKKIAFIGASSVFGKVDKQGGFVGRFKTWYEAGEPEKRCVFNLGIPGDNTTGMAKRAEIELISRQPDIIVIQLGSNDAAREGSASGKPTTTKTQFRKNVERLFKVSKSVTKNIVVVSAYPIVDAHTQPFKGTDKYYLLSDLTQYVEETKQLCKENNVRYLDLFSLFLKEKYTRYVFPDGLHFNEKGHQRIFNELKAFLVKHYL